MERISQELKLLSCRDLKAFNFFQKLSVYTVVYLISEEVKKQKPQRQYMQQQRQKTPVDREGGSSPEWNHAVKFDLNNVPYPCYGDHLFLKFQLRCKGVIFRNRNIGDVYVPLKDLIKESNGNARFVSYQVRNLNGKPNGVLSFSYKVKGEAKEKRIDTSTVGFSPGVHFPPEKIHHQPVEAEVRSPKTCFRPSMDRLRSPPPATRYGYGIYPSLRTDVPSPNEFYSYPIGDIYTSVTTPPPTIPMQLAVLAAGHRFPPQQYQSPLLPPPSAAFGWCRREEMDSNHGLYGQAWSRKEQNLMSRMMNKDSLTSSPPARKTKRCGERDINSSGAAIKVRKYDNSSASTSMLTHQDEILSTELKLFDETWITNNLDLYRTYIPIKKEPLPEYDEERQRIAASAINQDDILSTELKLFDETWINKNPELYLPFNPRRQEVFAEDAERKKIAASLSSMRFQDDRSGRSGVSTDIKLYEDPWKIRKKLTKSDVGHMSRLLVATDLVNDHILKFLTKEQASAIQSEEGLKFPVCDLDINPRNGDNNLYTLKLKQWDSNGSFVFLNGWSRNFVKRRSLREGDEIGLHWDSYYRRFHFSVLDRSEYL